MNSTMVSKQVQILESPDPPYSAICRACCPPHLVSWSLLLPLGMEGRRVSSWMVLGEGHYKSSLSLASQPRSRWSGTDGGRGVWDGNAWGEGAVCHQTHGFRCFRSEHLQPLTPSSLWQLLFSFQVPTLFSSSFPKQCLHPPSLLVN